MPVEEHIRGSFAWTFKAVADACHATSVAKGFYDEPFSEPEKIALMHSELSEALEAVRDGDPQSVKIPRFTQTEEEYADAVIRIMDTCSHRNLRLSEAHPC